MLSKEEIEKPLNNLWCSVTDVMFNVLYSQEEMQADLKIVLNEFKQLYNRNIKLEQENKKQSKIIDEMGGQLAGIAIWNNEKEEPLILWDKEDVKQYFEKKVEEN